MSVCGHTLWLSLHGEGGILMQRTNRLTSIVTALDVPARKWPNLVLLLGCSRDTSMMNEVLPRERKRYDHHVRNAVHLRLDSETAFSDRPILFAYGDTPKQVTFDPEPVPALCHSTTSKVLAWPDPTPSKALDALYCKLLYPFAGVICLFISHAERLEDVANRLGLWCKLQCMSASNLAVRPQLLVVCEASDARSSGTVYARLMKLLNQKSDHTINDYFSGISVFAQSSNDMTLKDRIRREVNISHNNRARHHLLLNAIHLDYFFNHACERFADLSQEPFDFVGASRFHRPVPADMTPHLADLLTFTTSYEELSACVVPLIAEYMVLDHYTYEVHCFDPDEVFEIHYRKVCLAASKNHEFRHESGTKPIGVILRAGLVRLIKQQFITRSMSHWHRRRARTSLLCEFGSWLSTLTTHRFCLACLHAIPEHKFPCGHIFCENCCVEMGQQQKKDLYLRSFEKCPLCMQPCDIRVRTKPPTAGVRVLSIDGGGIRAVIPIQFLRALDSVLGLDMPVQEHFDFAYGTSSGSMVTLALFGLGMTVDEVHNLFTQLAKRVFRGRVPFGSGIAAAAHSLIASYRNGQFPAEDIDGPLSEIFGDATMLDYPYMSAIGARIGFPIVDVDSHATPSTCLVTSYNGVGSVKHVVQEGEATYRVLRSSDSQDAIRTKDAVRCASAAPWYFTPHTIPQHGEFMDGGMSHNNPSQLALGELQRVVPGCKRPDQFVSVGTGSSRQQPLGGREHRSRLMFGSGSVYEAIQHYMAHHFDGDEKFRDMSKILRIAWPGEQDDIDRRFHRFNLLLDGKLPDLADAQAMESLSHAAWGHFASDPAVLDLGRAIIASNFYFELRCMPMFENGSYSCYGRILCRISAANSAFASFMQKVDSMSATFHIQQNCSSRRGKEGFSFDQTGNFSKPVSFRVRSLDDCVDVRVKLLSSHSYSISASPFTIATLISLQGLQWASLRRISPRAAVSTIAKQPSGRAQPVAKRRCVQPA